MTRPAWRRRIEQLLLRVLIPIDPLARDRHKCGDDTCTEAHP